MSPMLGLRLGYIEEERKRGTGSMYMRLPGLEEGVSDDLSVETYEQLRSELSRAMLRLCPPWLADQREDLVQTALIRVMKINRKSAGQKDLSKTYLWKVAHSALIDEIRRQRQRREVALGEDDEEEPMVTQAPNPEKRYAGRQLGQAIFDCLQKLIPPRRRAVTLYILGHGASEVAKLLGWSRRRAENLTFRGREDMRDCLAGKGWKQ